MNLILTTYSKTTDAVTVNSTLLKTDMWKNDRARNNKVKQKGHGGPVSLCDFKLVYWIHVYDWK